jgi:hypothetical protein
MMAVMFAAFRRCSQLAVQIGRRQLFDRRVRKPGPDFDALLRKQLQGTPPDAARNDDTYVLLAQPAREEPRRVRRWYHGSNADNYPLLGVCLHERKFPAAAKMSVKPAFGRGDCDGDHMFWFHLVGVDGAIATRIS